jgi:hypothetical protein
LKGNSWIRTWLYICLVGILGSLLIAASGNQKTSNNEPEKEKNSEALVPNITYILQTGISDGRLALVRVELSTERLIRI